MAQLYLLQAMLLFLIVISLQYLETLNRLVSKSCPYLITILQSSSYQFFAFMVIAMIGSVYSVNVLENNFQIE